MKFSTGFGLLALAWATAATAQPRRDENTARLSYSDKQEARADEPRRDGETVELASPTTTRHGKEFIVVGGSMGQFSQLRLDATKGRVEVHRVRIDFTDGKSKNVDVDKLLRKGKSTTIELGAPKGIERLVVTTDTSPAGEYAIYGLSGSTGVATR